MTTEIQDEDDRLMLRLKDGDNTAFDDLYRIHFAPLRGWFESRSPTLRSRALADDMAHDVLMKVYNEAKGFVPQGRFKAWMYRIARNLLIDSVRREAYDALVGGRQGGDQDDQLPNLDSGSSSVSELAHHNEIGDLVGELLEQLPEEQRLTFQTHYFLGLPLPEVAEIMETNTATTKSRLRLARDKLRELLRARGLKIE